MLTVAALAVKHKLSDKYHNYYHKQQFITTQRQLVNALMFLNFCATIGSH